VRTFLTITLATSGFASSTIDTNNASAFGANIGWINARADSGTNRACGQITRPR
jgi:hypothetical protein